MTDNPEEEFTTYQRHYWGLPKEDVQTYLRWRAFIDASDHDYEITHYGIARNLGVCNEMPLMNNWAMTYIARSKNTRVINE